MMIIFWQGQLYTYLRAKRKLFSQEFRCTPWEKHANKTFQRSSKIAPQSAIDYFVLCNWILQLPPCSEDCTVDSKQLGITPSNVLHSKSMCYFITHIPVLSNCVLSDKYLENRWPRAHWTKGGNIKVSGLYRTGYKQVAQCPLDQKRKYKSVCGLYRTGYKCLLERTSFSGMCVAHLNSKRFRFVLLGFLLFLVVSQLL